jgi:hypothetical protein
LSSLKAHENEICEVITIVPKMSKRLIVNPQLKAVSMLDYAQSILPYVPWKEERCMIPKSSLSQ